MSIQRHPVSSFNRKVNFWEEFPDYKVHPIFGDFWRINKKNDQLEASSLFMWGLALCYDRTSSLFNQPEQDKWEVVSEDLFQDSQFMLKLVKEPEECKVLSIVLGGSVRTLINAFEESIDTPLGIALRRLEKKLIERTDFITDTEYKLDYYETTQAGKVVIKKGTADQLDRMFTNTDKINSLVQKALDDLRSSEGLGVTKGNEMESLGDGDKAF
jgi:hypothetical protein